MVCQAADVVGAGRLGLKYSTTMRPISEAYRGDNPHMRIAAAAREAAAKVQAKEVEKKIVEENSKADDAIIVGIGICAVLIVNVAFVGYLTPPGGSSPPWADCYYPTYLAFVYLNGFALVFSITAIFAVLVGPYVVVACRQPNWRKPVVQVGLLYVVISLGMLLGAFACAGFILASLNIPDLTCAQLTCSQGGVFCTPFHLAYGSRNVSWYGTSYSLLNRPPLYVYLDPQLARLNNDTLGEDTHGESPGSAVTCRDYSYMAKMAGPGGQHSLFENLTLLDKSGQYINRTCYVLLSQTVFGHGSFRAEPRESPVSDSVHPGSESEDHMLMDWHAMRPNPLMLWCSPNQTSLGPGWLPLPMATAYDLLKGVGSFPEPDLNAMRLTTGVSSSGGNDKPACPENKGFEGHANVLLTRQGDVMAYQLLPNYSNPWLFPDELAMQSQHSVFHPPAVANSYTGFGGMYNDVQSMAMGYYTALGWEGKGSGFPCQSNHGYKYPWCQYHHKIKVLDRRPLSSAMPYATLRYQCSGADHGVLCDYSANPPLAVDELGNRLSRQSLASQDNAILYDGTKIGEKVTTVWVEYAVVAMLLVAFASNLGSVLYLAFYPFPYLGRLKHAFSVCRL